MTIKQMNDVLNDLRKIYNFQDDKTHIHLHNLITCREDKVTIETVDDTGIEIQLSKELGKLNCGEMI